MSIEVKSGEFHLGEEEIAVDDDLALELSRLSNTVKELLEYCAANELDVPKELKERLARTVRAVAERGTHTDFIVEKQNERRKSIEDIDAIHFLRQFLQKTKADMPNFELKVKNGSYTVTNYIDASAGKETVQDGPRRAKQKIRTVRTESPLYKIVCCFVNLIKGHGRGARKEEKIIMDKVNITLEPGKMYLVLGAPGCGKSTLLKMIANTLYQDRNHVANGEVSIAGITPDEKNIYWTNLVAYIDQIDRLHPFLTVQETCEFAWKCRTGGTHRTPFLGKGSDIDKIITEMDESLVAVNKILDVLGLTRVKDTFVGDQSRVRGVSGGEKKRVTVAEMLVINAPVICCDEISTGLDAATTFDITRTMAAATQVKGTVSVVSLLQPPPETVANFDELILLAEGKIIYFGPVDDVVHYFNSLGYEIPERMDVADWLQTLPTKDGKEFLKKTSDPENPDNHNNKAVVSEHLTPEQFRDKFHESDMGKALMERVNAPITGNDTDRIRDYALRRYANSWYKSMKLVASRELLLWWRDKYSIRAKVGQDIVMGVIVGTLFFQKGGESPQDLMGVLFQAMFFGCVGAMIVVVAQFPDRSIFYKHQDSNFFPTSTYVIGKSLASVPNGLFDAIIFGSLIYFLVGLAINDGASVANYFVFMTIAFVVSWTSGLFFSVYAASVATITAAQALMAVTAILFVLFCGFTVQPDVLEGTWGIVVYWINYFSWTFRAIVVNEFASGRYDSVIVTATGEEITEGEAILTRFGFTDTDGIPYTFEWAGWGILFALGSGFFAVLLYTFFLSNVRYVTGQSLVTDAGDDEGEDFTGSNSGVEMPFKPTTLTFKGVRYTVTASTSDEKLELLKGIDGVIEAGKMTALMGSSGAGKTTLMDVLAMRKSKSSGEIVGDIRVNGFPQEEKSFRRCTGYVEQFDYQSPQLTIRETCDFSAKLRLDESDPAVTPQSTAKFVDQILSMLELTIIQDLQVGSDEEGGLSFEQKKRLSIAIELVANCSLIFLDEPTSGLDARSAAIVMRGLRRIADTGRAVCATIHQPSIAIFNDFDELLLLKRGGETVFFGELGQYSSKLIEYLERYDSTSKIRPGENPATWMLTCIGAGSAASNKKPFDYAGSYNESKLHSQCLERIERICEEANKENEISYQDIWATSRTTQSFAVLRRAFKVYFRSPNYNVTRVIVSAVVALLFGSVYASQRVPKNESDMNSRINSMFMAILFLCVNAQNSVLSVFETERNMFYRHKASNMYDTKAILLAFTFAEIPFIIVTSVVFCVVFYFIMGFAEEADKFFLFLLFVLFGFSAFTFIGQMLVTLFRDSMTAQGFGGLMVSLTALFSGILIRPDSIPNFWIFLYWVAPGHYIFEGIFMSQFNNDDTPITATVGSPFFYALGCADPSRQASGEECVGTAEIWVSTSFPDFSVDHIKYNIIYLVMLLLISRIVSFIALTNLNYRRT